ncbi:DUF5107 domain-containing protein [Phaeacidiphilus oryzae]|uniref:DUF5107 domain-containing protein n=1 Tax=Phaeacidiphilus oryzae TaxID=348818 RepID=UPI00068A73FB|nr:DUF5107 domain-containing protein [Phaeacidiphilus oryzae]
MSSLGLGALTLPTAELGPLNPLPPLPGLPALHGLPGHAGYPASPEGPGWPDGPAGGPAWDGAPSEPEDGFDAELLRDLRYGRVDSVLPYLLRDGYGRERRPRRHPAAVLENDRLRAVFLPGTGGRLWSLTHLPTGRELLHANPVHQPAALALRDAWVAGGVEWNIGTTGHSPTTCEPLHTVRARRPDGQPVLRMYEYERLRRVVFRIDAWLPDGSELLLVHVRIVNPNDRPVPMYWWSNAAVPETEGTRVLTPATAAWRFDPGRRLARVRFPDDPGDPHDSSYPALGRCSADHFFDLAGSATASATASANASPPARPWIAALGADGSGLVQASTARLRGRKLFRWGRHPGGRNWQEWLNGGTGRPYLEIQAGLARTQLEHLPMPPRAAWSWLEAYGRLAADPLEVHSPDWGRAVAAAGSALDALLPEDRLNAELADAQAWLGGPPTAVLHRGSGWGALERHLRARSGDPCPALHDPATPFPDDTLGPEEEPWLTLLSTGRMTGAAPVSYQADQDWAPLLADAGRWLAELLLGVVHAAQGRPESAAAAWRRSLADAPNGWAWRDLGVLAAARGDRAEAADALLAAWELMPHQQPLLLEAVAALLAAERPRDALGLVERAGGRPAGATSLTGAAPEGRLRLLEARAALESGDPDRCGALLRAGIVLPNIREGELSLAELWELYRAARPEAGPLPPDYDFAMRPPDSCRPQDAKDAKDESPRA